MDAAHIKLRERVKELKCLYALSKAAWDADNDVQLIVRRTLDILPSAMQFPDLAEASIVINGKTESTPGFLKSQKKTEAPIIINQKKVGSVRVSYRSAANKNVRFLPEEGKLIGAVARELSLFIKRAAVEEDKEKLQMQLQHVERLAFVGELSAGIAHELNEPLARILGFAQLIRKTGNLGDQQGEDIERIVKASLYTREIIKKLMLFSRQMPQKITKVDANTVVRNILYFIDVRFHGRGIRILQDLDPSLPVIRADEVQISQVLVNLITNAVHAVAAGGDVTVKTRNKKTHITLVVQDTGIGMTPEVRAHIFEPFFTTKPVGQGTGLGLSVVQGIIDSHEGKITVSSTPGKGSKFEVTLPVTIKKRR